MKLAAFIHTATISNYKPINDEVLNVIKDYGLLDQLDYLCFGVVGDGPINLPYQSSKIEVCRFSPNPQTGEIPTTAAMQEYCRENPDSIVFKGHVAGIKSGSKEDGTPKDSKYPIWRYLQYYHLFVEFQRCLDIIDTCDAAGIELQIDPVPHFSGTHYLAKASYINKLPSIYDLAKMSFNGIAGAGIGNWHCCEFLPGMYKNANLISLFDTGFHWIERLKAIEEVVKPHLNSIPIYKRYWTRYYNQETL